MAAVKHFIKIIIVKEANVLTCDTRQEVVRGCKILHSLGLIDMLGNISVRVPDKHAFAIKPGAGLGVPAPHQLQIDDVLIVDFDGQVIEGKHQPPRDVQMYCQIYRARADVGAIVHTHQELATAFATAHRPLKAIGHVEAELVIKGTPFWGSGELVATPEQGKNLADTLGDGTIVLLPGHGMVCVGAGHNLAILNAHSLEVLSEFNMIANGVGGIVGSITKQGFDKLNA